jgi:hypothetical protein
MEYFKNLQLLKGNFMSKIFTTKRFIDFVHAIISESIKFLKISFIVGSQTAFFSVSQCLSPLIGLWSGTVSSCVVFFIRTIFGWSSLGISLFSTLYHIPTFCGALYLSTSSKLVRASIPLLCILLFVTHPIGSQSFVYSFYWFIPIFIAFYNTKSIFLQALGSTFAQHAVGSIIWLYSKNMSPIEWNALISIVWAERLLFALTATILYYVVINIKQWLENTKPVFNLSRTIVSFVNGRI